MVSLGRLPCTGTETIPSCYIFSEQTGIIMDIKIHVLACTLYYLWDDPSRDHAYTDRD